LVDANTGVAIDARDLYAGPGPSFPEAEEVRAKRFSEFYEARLGPRNND
jgi:hypothetical protein